ncbi:hypothetical protein TeGR_g5613 [Tetraparma gracilis]|nr:hypothetical protein TeGR_g5613 [Tetraparma gracilis]
MGTDGGLLGVGAPEVFTIVAVGWLILGPTELFKLSKELGKVVSSVRAAGDGVTRQWTEDMEGQVALEDIRKAKRDLDDAFSFRRTINWDEEQAEADEERAREEELAGGGKEEGKAAGGGVAAAAGPKAQGGKPRKIRRRVRKQAEPEPEPEEPPPFDEPTAEGEEPIGDTYPDLPGTYPDLSADDSASPAADSAAADDKFASQLDMDAYNAAIMERGAPAPPPPPAHSPLPAGDPMSVLSEQLSLLAEEKEASLKRFEEAMEEKRRVEDRYFEGKRRLLEEAMEAAKKQEVTS